MRSAAILQCGVLGVLTNAFMPQSVMQGARLSKLAAGDKIDGYALMRSNFKKILVPTYKEPYKPLSPVVNSESASGPSPLDALQHKLLGTPAAETVPSKVQSMTQDRASGPPSPELSSMDLPRATPRMEMPKFDVHLPHLEMPDIPTPHLRWPQVELDTSGGDAIAASLQQTAQKYAVSIQKSESDMVKMFRDRTSSLPPLPALDLTTLKNAGFDVNEAKFAEVQQGVDGVTRNVQAVASIVQDTVQSQVDALSSSIASEQAGPLSKLAAALAAFGELASEPGWSGQDALAALSPDELGGWYVLALSILAASLAAAGTNADLDVTGAMDYVAPAPAPPPVNPLVVQIEQLTATTNSLSAELKKIKTEKAARDYEVATMKSDMRQLQNQLDATVRAEEKLQRALLATEQKLEAETQRLQAELDSRTQREIDLSQRLATAEAALTQEQEKVRLTERRAQEQLSQAQAAVARLQAEKDNMRAELDSLSSEAAELAQQLGAPVPRKPTPAPSKPAADVPPQFLTVSVDDVPEIELPQVAKSPSKTAATPKAKARKVGARKVTKKTAAAKATAPSAPADEWSNITEAAVKRKTVKELSDYLESQGQTTTDRDGKPLKKADLVDAVLAVIA